MESNWELTIHEREVIYPLVVGVLSHRGKEKVFSNTKIRKILLEFGEEITDTQIRKIAFNIRKKNDIPLLLANSEGYFVGSNIGEVNAWIAMHKGKIESMKATLSYIEDQFEQNKKLLQSGENCGLVGQTSIYDFI